MEIDAFEWDDKNIEHIAYHNVSPEEVEEVFVGAPLYRKTREKKHLALGQTLDGRYLFVVFAFKRDDRIRPITARDMNLKEVKSYKRWLRR